MESRPVRRKDRVMPQADIERFLSENDVCHAAVTSVDGVLQIVPLHYTYDGAKFILSSQNEACLAACAEAAAVTLDISVMYYVSGRDRTPCKNITSKYRSVLAFGEICLCDEQLTFMPAYMTGKSNIKGDEWI